MFRGNRTYFAILAASTSMIALAAPAFAQDAAGQESEVVVTGIRQSLQTSAERKRNALEVVDSITAEDIGKLPDANVAETMTRIPGVQGYRYAGEGASPVGVGSGLTIRGLSGQTASRVDGRAYFTAGQREFNIEGAIPGMIAGIDVYKNPSAEHIEGGIGGLVNIRTRRPLEFEGLTYSIAANARYNDLAESARPEIFGLWSNRWDLGGGEFGFLVAANYQESHNRSDSNPANGGTSLRRAVRADDPEYAVVGGNPAYAGRSDVWHLADVADPLAPSAAQREQLVTAVTQQAPIFQEDIYRTRKGFTAAAQWAPNDNLEFYAETNYNYYLYHQEYRFLFANDTRTVQNLTTTPFELRESLANRNSNGGADELLAGQALTGGAFLDSTLSTTGGDEDHPYETWIVATGFEWRPTDRLDVRFDIAYVKSDQSSDNRSASLVSAPGLTWDIARDLTTEPHQINISGGPPLDAASTWLFNDYSNGTNNIWDDDGGAAQLDLTYEIDSSFLTALKFGTRYAIQRARFSSFNFSGRPLTSDGLPLAADRSNAIPVASLPNLLEFSPTNWMDGQAGYAGGYYVFSPQTLLRDNVRNNFPLAAIPPDDALPEVVINRRFAREETYAAYLVGEFSMLNDRIEGNVGVRAVQTDLFARAMVANVPPPGFSVLESTASYTDVLPSLNIIGHITDELQIRFGYGKGLTRPGLDALNPAISINTTNGLGGRGNPDLRPYSADSYDVSLEWYINPTSYVAIGVFDKEIDGFFNGIAECETVANVPPYVPGAPNGCPAGQYLITRTVNSESGYARGLELSGQTFFDFLPGVWSNFGVQASYAYVDTENPVRFATNGPLVDVPQAFQSEHNYSIAGLYEDDRLSARLVYTYRSDYVLFGVSANPIDGRYVAGYGLLDASLTYNLVDDLSLNLNVSNITEEAPSRFVGEPGDYATDFERQHYENGRIYSVGLRYRFGG